MGEELGLVVVAEEALREVAAVTLVDDPAVRVAGDVDRRDVDHPVEPRGREGIEHTMGRADVRVVHLGPFAGRDADAVHTRDVDGGLGAAHRVDDGGRSGEIALPEIDAHLLELFGACGIADDGGHPVAARHQSTDDRFPDEPGTTGDEDAHQRGAPGRWDARDRISRSGCRARPIRATP